MKPDATAGAEPAGSTEPESEEKADELAKSFSLTRGREEGKGYEDWERKRSGHEIRVEGTQKIQHG
jgi:hypothetical protein